MSMDRLEAMRTFVRVVERGSFSAVAKELGATQSAVSKQIAALEARLGAKLLVRSTRAIALTRAGEAFFPRRDDFERNGLPKGLPRRACSSGSGATKRLVHDLIGPRRIDVSFERRLILVRQGKHRQ